jgi:hypothetical protein
MTILDEFKTNAKKRRGKLIVALAKRKGKQVTLPTLIRTVYGARAGNNHAMALKMNLRGLTLSIKKRRLPYKVVKTRSEKGELSYGLHSRDGTASHA